MCINCQRETTNPKFCSRRCAAIYNNTLSPKRRLEGRCRICQTTVSSKRRRCNTCLSKRNETRKNRTIGQLRQRNPIQIHSEVRDLARKVAGTIKSCAICGYSLHVEVCHVRPIKDYPNEALVSEVNNPSNLVVLCRNHHWELDNGHLAILPHHCVG